MSTIDLDTEDRKEAQVRGAIALMWQERKAKIEAMISEKRVIIELLTRDLADVTQHSQNADRAIEELGAQLADKYGLTDGDTIDFEAGQITTQTQSTPVAAGASESQSREREATPP